MSHFNQVADRYDAYAHVQQSILKWAQPFIHSASDRHILEMGAGTGLFTEHLLSLQAQSILATDASPRMLAQCQKRFSGDSRVHYRVMNAWQPEMDGFDAVYSSNLLQWAENPLSVITHWKRCLHATGGHIHAVFFIDQTLCELRELLPNKLLPIQWRTRDYWDHLFESAGMKIRFSRAEESIHWHRDAMELFRLFKNTGVNSRNLLNAGVLRSVMRQYHERFRVQNRIQSTWHYYQIEASC
jgi:SAM-dependent methyltransferase